MLLPSSRAAASLAFSLSVWLSTTHAWAESQPSLISTSQPAVLQPISPANATSSESPSSTTRIPLRQAARVEFSFLAYGARLVDSEYRRVLTLFDRTGIEWGGGAVLSGLWVPVPWLRVGGRVGWLASTAERTSSSVMYEIASMGFHTLDISGVMRAVYLTDPLIGGLRLDVSAEFGVVVGGALMRNITETIVSFRAGGSVFVGYQAPVPGILLGVRVGAHHVPWDRAGVGPADPVFSGGTLGLEVGGLL